MKLELKQHKEKNKRLPFALISFCILLVTLIFVREIYSISFNKYLFVLLTIVGVCMFSYEDTLTLLFFMMPFFSGLPSNYIRLVILIALILKRKSSKYNAKIIFCSLLYFALELLHITVTSSAMEYIFWGISLLLLVFVASENVERIDSKKCIIAFSIATVIAFLIIFIRTINMGYLGQILSGRYRFGDFYELGVYTEGIHLSIDPNYLSFFCLTSVIGQCALLSKKMISKPTAAVLILMNTLWGMISLSRTFLLLLSFFILSLIYHRRKNLVRFIGTVFAIVFVGAVALVLIKSLYPAVLESMQIRMTNADVVSGGGRLDLLSEFFFGWIRNPIYILFGTGCIAMLSKLGHGQNLHCAPMEVLVGSGLIGFIIVTILIIEILKQIRKTKTGYLYPFDYYTKICALIQFLFLALLPVMANISQLMPIMICVMIAKLNNEQNSSER